MPVAVEKFTIMAVNRIWQDEFAVAHAQTLARSFKCFTQRDLLAGNFPAAEFSGKLFDAPFVLVSHGT